MFIMYIIMFIHFTLVKKQEKKPLLKQLTSILSKFERAVLTHVGRDDTEMAVCQQTFFVL